jgi:hypothetical protein
MTTKRKLKPKKGGKLSVSVGLAGEHIPRQREQLTLQ